MNEKDFGSGLKLENLLILMQQLGGVLRNFQYIITCTFQGVLESEEIFGTVQTAILYDVAVEKQVEITGDDAFKFIQLLTPRDLSKLSIDYYVLLITNAEGGILNDPVLLR